MVPPPPAKVDLPAGAPAPIPPPLPAGSDASTDLGGRLVEMGVGTRLDLRVQNPKEPKKLDKIGLDGQVQVFLSGRAARFVKWQADFVGSLGQANDAGLSPAARGDGNASVLDLIAKLELHEAANLWLGRMPVAADRSGLSTVWGMAPWIFPGVAIPGLDAAGARQGPFGRSDGVTFWGQLRGGAFKYYAGVFDLTNPNHRPLYSGRINISFMSPEPGYRNASSYYGRKDLLAVGVGFQYQPDGSTRPPTLVLPGATDHFSSANVDLLFEKNLHGAGVFDLEAAYCKHWGEFEPVDHSYFGLVSYLMPIDVGVGRFQPLFRVQQARSKGLEETATIVDAQLGFIIDGASARVALGYQYSELAGKTGNTVVGGVQIMTK